MTREAGNWSESDTTSGLPSRYIDPETELLGQLAAMWQDFQQMRKAAAQRGLSGADVKVLLTAERHFGNALTKALRRHPVWPWLSEYPGLGGVHCARLIARIGDPRRFPGQRCSMGHTFVPGLPVGSPCLLTDRDGEGCPGSLQPPRTTTGVRSVWHYLGLHVVDGRSPRKTRGQQIDWDPLGRTAVLQPDGIADAIVRNRVPVYRDTYDTTRERLTRERGAEGGPESDIINGLRPFQVDAIARKVAAKAFIGDLLAEWKRLAGADIEDRRAA